MKAIAIILLMTLAVAVSLFLGRVLPIVLPQASPLLDRKPFNCRPCTTFHITWLLMAGIAYGMGSWTVLVVGVVLAFIIFGRIWFTETKIIWKTKNY